MKTLVMRTLKCVSVLAVGFLVTPSSAQPTTVLTNSEDRTSYTLGVDVARNLRRQGVGCNVDLLIKGVQDGFSDQKLLISELEFRDLLSKFQNELRRRQAMNRGKTVAEMNKRRGEIFLAENQAKPGVATLTNGLQYRILKAGTGPKPTADDTVQCYYRATLLDGTELVCSNPGQPVTFKAKEGDILAWRQVLPLMPAGSKWRLFIPSSLAYGVQGVRGTVGPNEAIMSDLELVATK
jgi:FKBP-type peptidyl-prolyl cis-trans isomerase